ncbi:unnamed protein product [Prorocentrum cordatum]|uniref:Uncharacterized protein n=1 Tax=Prorocentrum cordatum TaxID=2364126 RepID=A0ABN9WI21_9DINO|nr:unnamed protein product [Polarella glacialis]
MAEQPSPAKQAREKAAAEAAAHFEARAAEVRAYLDASLGQQVHEGLKEVASQRPAEPRAALAGLFQGKKSLGEIAKETQEVHGRRAAVGGPAAVHVRHGGHGAGRLPGRRVPRAAESAGLRPRRRAGE